MRASDAACKLILDHKEEYRRAMKALDRGFELISKPIGGISSQEIHECDRCTEEGLSGLQKIGLAVRLRVGSPMITTTEEHFEMDKPR